MRVACIPVITCAENRTMIAQTTLARSLAPEDIQVGNFVMVLHRQSQVMMSKCTDSETPEVVVIPVVTRPAYPELPAKVIDICLPFVVVRRESKKTEIIDTRSERLARVPEQFAKAALKPHMPKKKKGSKKNK